MRDACDRIVRSLDYDGLARDLWRGLIVGDDGDHAPAEEAAIRTAGGRLIRVVSGTILGTKLNLGVEATQGSLCQKIDDDDWYAPAFLSTMISAVLESWRVVC